MIINSNTYFKITEFALQAILYEASCCDKPGLVSPVSRGAHDDMDYFTFIDSTCSIAKTLNLCSSIGFSSRSIKEIFKAIRKEGISGEKEMLNKTGGVNTHKGMLFLMGICCSSVSKCIYEKKSFRCIKNIIKEMTKGICERELVNKKFVSNKSMSHGEKIYYKYGYKGVRGQVEEGLPLVLDIALNYYENNAELQKNDRLLQTLLYIMQYNDDTNILYRHSKEVLADVKEMAHTVLAAGGVYTEEGTILLNKMNMYFNKMKISPGGSADLLAITVFFSLVKGYMADF